MTFRLENDEGLPWTASTRFGWIVFLVVLTSGVAAYLLSLYLALWIRSKGRSALPLYGFALVMFAIPIETFAHGSSWAEAVLTVLSLVWIAASFSLRHEIKAYFWKSEEWDIQIGYTLTLFLSSMYINYCLNPVTFKDEEAMTSLNLTHVFYEQGREASNIQR